MKKLTFRLFAVILSIYVAGSVVPLFATQQPAPSAPAPPPPPPSSGPAQIDTKLSGPAPSGPRDYGGEGCCGGGGGATTPGEAPLTSAMDQIGVEYDQKGDEAKAKVDAAYSEARRVLLNQTAAKYDPEKINKELDAVNGQINAVKSRLDPIDSEQHELRSIKGVKQWRGPESGVFGLLHDAERNKEWNKWNQRDEDLEKQAAPLRQELAKLEAKKAELTKQLTAITQKADYKQEAARIDAAIAAGKAKRYGAINATVNKAKTNAISKALGAKIPEGSTSSYDIEASVPSVGSLIKELSPGR